VKFDTRLLILEGSLRSAPDRPGGNTERRRVLGTVAAAGARVRHDSGGRLLVIETSDRADETLRRTLPGATIVPLTADVADRVPDLDPSDSLFVQALAIRQSPAYRRQKERRKPGESPEERLLFTAPCMPEG
jgi:hypothetical protein